MHRSFIHKGPVITILTQSQQSSHQMQKFLQSMFQTQTIHIPLESQSQSEVEKEDKLNQIFPSSSSSSMSLLKKYQYQFNSSISICESSSTILHFLSIDQQTQNQNQNSDVTTDKHDLMTILAITPGPSSASASAETNHETIYTNYIQPTRDTICDQILRNQTGNNNDSTSSSSSSSMFGIKLALKKYMNYNPISNFDLLLHDLPLLDLSPSSSSPPMTSTSTSTSIPSTSESDNHNDAKSSSFHLREIVLPFYDTTTYPNGQSILQSFSKSKLQRPTIGLYQWTDDNDDNENNNIVFRPLPSPSTDMNLPPITFVYQCQSLNDAKEHVIQQQTQMDNENENIKSRNQELSFTLTKVGFNGYQNNGQLRIENYLTQNDANNNGNDTANDNDNNTAKYSLPSSFEFRYCNANELSSSFAEAQESLLAGSLDDLQNVNVMAEGNGHVQGLGQDHSRGQVQEHLQGNPSMKSGEDIQNGIKIEKTTFSSSSSSSTNNNNNTNNANDAMNGLGDCWVEFRANMKQPSGFFKKQPNGNNNNNKNNNSSSSSNNNGGSNLFSSSVQNLFGKRGNNGNSTTNTVNGHARSTRVAKAPDIPYE